METPSRREFPRVHHESDILYAPGETFAFRESRMRNFSKGGIYFETMELLPENSKIHIMMEEDSPDAYGPGAYQSYSADIRWRRNIQQNGRSLYGFGVRFLEIHHEPLKTPVILEKVVCEMCGALESRTECQMNDEFVVFCPTCRNHVDHLPDGNLKDCIDRFLLGNVV